MNTLQFFSLPQTLHRFYRLPSATVVTVILTISSIILLSGLISSLRLLLPLLLLTILAINYKLNDLFVSSFLTTLYSMPLFTPNKYYSIEVIRGYELFLPEYRAGYWQGFGVNIFNLMWIISSVVLIRDSFRRKVAFDRKLLRLLPAWGSLLLFFFVGLIVSHRYSPAFDLSFTWLMQYAQIIPASALLVYTYVFKKRYFPLILSVIMVMILFQSFIAFWQFLLQSNIGLPLESGRGTSFATGLDENNAIFRVAGTLLFHNQLALTTLILIILYLPRLITRQKKRDLIVFIAATMTILLTQSRSTWVAFGVILLITFKVFRPRITLLVTRLNLRKALLFALPLLSITLLVMIPRIVLTFNTFYQGAGLPIRQRLIQEGAEALRGNPLVGYGIGTNPFVLHRLFPTGVMAVFPTAVHFAPLQLALETGTAGVFFFFFPFIFIIRQWLTHRYPTRQSHSHSTRHFFVFICASLAITIYYTFLPHIGIIEFQYLGLILGTGLISLV